MNKTNVIAIVGDSGSGKTYASMYLQMKFKWKAIVSYTTRPMREEEIQKSNPCYQKGVYGFKSLGYEKAIEIVNQLAEEYNNESVNSDLISREKLIKEIEKEMQTKDIYLTAIKNVIINLIKTQPSVKGSD